MACSFHSFSTKCLSNTQVWIIMVFQLFINKNVVPWEKQLSQLSIHPHAFSSSRQPSDYATQWKCLRYTSHLIYSHRLLQIYLRIGIYECNRFYCFSKSILKVNLPWFFFNRKHTAVKNRRTTSSLWCHCFDSWWADGSCK